MLKQWECHSDNTFTILHYEVAAERVAYTHTHISEVVMCVSNTNYTISMLAKKFNKCRQIKTCACASKCNMHTHISEVVMRVSDTNYTVSMLANKCRRTTFATSFITIIYLLDLCYNLSNLTLMFMLINDQIKGDWL